MGDACRELGVPIVSGNVSLYNETEGNPIQPTPTVGCVGVLDDIEHASQITWGEGDDIWLAGDGPVSLGGSEYLHTIHGIDARGTCSDRFRTGEGDPRIRPGVLLPAAKPTVSTTSASGGLAVALAEFAMTSGLGATVDSASSQRTHGSRLVR